jgi:translation initiation factor 5B
MIRQPIITVLGHVDHGKCVTGETLVALANGQIQTIKSLYENYENCSNKLLDTDGLALEINKPLFVLGEKDGKIKQLPITHIWKLRKNNIFKVTLNDGQTVNCTPEHPFLCMDFEGNLIYKKTQDLSEKDFVATPKKLQEITANLKQVKEIILNKLTQNTNLIAFVEEELTQEIAISINSNKYKLITNQPRDCIKHNRFRLNDITSSIKNTEFIFDNIKYIKYSTKKQRASHRSLKIKIPKTKDEIKKMMYVAGMVFGDGTGQTLNLSNIDNQLLNNYVDFFGDILGTKKLIKKDKTCFTGVNTAYKSGNELFTTLFDIPSSKKSHTIKFPQILYSLPNEYGNEFIKGYLDTDGYVLENKNIEVSSSSKEFLTGLQLFLKRNSINAQIKKNQTAHRLTISGKNNLCLATKTILFKLERKKQPLLKNKNKQSTNRIFDLLPINGQMLKQARIELGANATELKIPYQKKNETYKQISNSALKQFINRLEEFQTNPANKTKINKNKQILKLLKTPQTYEQILSNIIYDHRQLINKLKSMESDELIIRENNKYFTTLLGKQILKNKTKQTYQKLKSISDFEINFVKVTSVKKIQTDDDWVYDLTQPKTNNFVANGIIIHNTSLLDAIRSSRVAAREAGAITQHIGATEIPAKTIKEVAGPLLDKFGFKLSIPGLLVIDTPGHEAFTNLRKRGGSIADLAVLVVDVMQGLQPQTIEAINILRTNKVPFIIAMNKIDMLNFYSSKEGSFLANLANQNENTKRLLDEKLYIMVGKIFEQGFVCERFDRCEFGKQIPIVPCSAKTKEGLPEILTLLAGLSQKYLENKLTLTGEEKAKGAILEAKEEKGLGKTIDVVLYEGKLQVNDEIAVIGKNGIIRTKIRVLLQPKPLQEMMDTKDKFVSVKEVISASGVKISAPGLDDVLVGSTLIQVREENDIIELKKEIQENSFKADHVGLIVKADAIGSLEAIVNLFRQNEITIKKADIGNVSRKDVMEAAGIACENPFLGTVIAFNVNVEKDAEKEANLRDIRIFSDRVVYKLIDDYKEWVKKSKQDEKDKSMSCLVLPVKFKVIKLFRNNKPAIVGVQILEGRLKEGWKIMNDKGEIIGKITGMESEGEKVKEVKKDDEVAISIDDGNIGKNLFMGDILYSCIPAKQYCELNKYIDEFSEDERNLLSKIRKTQMQDEEK